MKGNDSLGSVFQAMPGLCDEIMNIGINISASFMSTGSIRLSPIGSFTSATSK
jgi:hypothetical protein